MVWHLIRYLLSFSIPSFYHKIEGKNAHFLQKKGPAIIAMNHPNAFVDPLCITWLSYPARLKYMARGDAFKSGIITFILNQIGIVPIYRMRDGGREGLDKNDASYITINNLLQKNAKVIIFAEGLCIQERRLRPLKKGVSRMVFGAQEFLQNEALHVIPVGINYTKANKFRSNVFYNFGEPINISEFKVACNDNLARTNNQFLQHLELEMKKLVTHINNPLNDELVEQIEKLMMQEMLEKHQLSNTLENEFTMTVKLTNYINSLDTENPELLNTLRDKTKNYFTSLKKNNVRDWMINPMNQKMLELKNLIFRIIAIVLTSPIYLLGYATAYPAYKFIKFSTNKLVGKNKEFYASISIGLGSFIFLANFTVWFFIIYIFSTSIIAPLLFTSTALLSAWLTMQLHFYYIKTISIKRFRGNTKLKEELSQKRAEIRGLLNALT